MCANALFGVLGGAIKSQNAPSRRNHVLQAFTKVFEGPPPLPENRAKAPFTVEPNVFALEICLLRPPGPPGTWKNRAGDF